MTDDIIPIIIPVRIESKRLPSKVIREFYKGKSLTEITCEKFSGKDHVYLVAHEEEFQAIAQKTGIGFIKRSYESAMGEYFRDIFTFLDDMPYERFLAVNVCAPFTRASIVESVIELIKAQNFKSLMAVTETKDLFFNDQKIPINEDALILNSRLRKPIYKKASNFDLITKERIKKCGRHFESYQPNDPYLYPISHHEALDIHTEEDFKLLHAIYNYTMRQETSISE
jgi:CMP-N-acetylneuraminic acid synthetase